MVVQASSFDSEDFVVPAHEVWYIRKSGWIRGPYTRADMQRFRQLGWLGRSESVSRDMRTWQTAGTVPGLWEDRAPADRSSAARDAPEPQQPAVVSASHWRYTVDAKAADAAVSFATLQILASLGRLAADDLVWREGWPEWRRVADIPGLLAGPSEWCTACGEPVNPRSRRCGSCSAVLPGFKPPHSELCTACGILGVVLFPAFPLWLIAVAMGHHDLTEIARGRMDPGGANAAKFGLRLGTIGGVLCGASITIALVYVIIRMAP
jgi:hypothetical protein